MIINLNAGVTKENAIERIDHLIAQSNKINGDWNNDEAFYSWDEELRTELNQLFKDIEIISSVNLKGRYSSNLGLELTKIVTPSDYEKRREERSENNKTVFLHQVSKLIELKNNVSSLQNELKNRKITISVSDSYGIYKNQKTKKPNYSIRESKRLNLIKFLKDKSSSSKKLIDNFKYTDQLLSKEIKEINDNFKKNLNLKKDLIIHLSTGGYQLNYEMYHIIFI